MHVQNGIPSPIFVLVLLFPILFPALWNILVGIPSINLHLQKFKQFSILKVDELFFSLCSLCLFSLVLLLFSCSFRPVAEG